MNRLICLWLLSLFLIFSISSFSQERKIDSLLFVLKTAKEDTNKVNLLDKISQELKNSNPKTALLYAKQTVSLAEKLEYESGLARANITVGIIYKRMANYEKSREYLLKALKTYEEYKDKFGLSSCYVNLGNVCFNTGDYSQALSYYLKSLRINEELKDERMIAISCNNIGMVYDMRGNYEQALNYYEKALSIRKKMDDEKGIADCYNNMGMVYDNQKKYNLALEKYFNSLETRKNIGDTLGIAASYTNIGAAYYNIGQYSDAKKFFRNTLFIGEKIGDTSGIVTSYINLATVENVNGNSKEALHYLQAALEIARAIGEKDAIKDCYSSFSEVYAKINDFKNAYEFHKKYSETKDSLLNEESSKQITEMQTKYETEKKEQQITLLNKDKEIQQASIDRQQTIIWFVAGGFLLVVVFSVFIFREKRKSEKLLLNILPKETAKELKQKGKASPKYYENVTVMFTDFKGFTQIAEKLSADELVSQLDFIFRKFDEIISKYQIEKIKTIGDAYMCVSGLPIENSSHAEEIVKAALEIQNFMNKLPVGNPPACLPDRRAGRAGVQLANGNSNLQTANWQLRIGIHSGPLTAGVVGDKKFAYDIWGDTVNTANRMESSCEPNKVNISGEIYRLLQNSEFKIQHLKFQYRGKIPAKNKGEIEMYFVEEK